MVRAGKRKTSDGPCPQKLSTVGFEDSFLAGHVKRVKVAGEASFSIVTETISDSFSRGRHLRAIRAYYFVREVLSLLSRFFKTLEWRQVAERFDEPSSGLGKRSMTGHSQQELVSNSSVSSAPCLDFAAVDVHLPFRSCIIPSLSFPLLAADLFPAASYDVQRFEASEDIDKFQVTTDRVLGPQGTCDCGLAGGVAMASTGLLALCSFRSLRVVITMT